MVWKARAARCEKWSSNTKRALKEARHALWIETRERAVIVAAVIGVSIVLIWFVGGREMATTEIIIRATELARLAEYNRAVLFEMFVEDDAQVRVA